MIKLIRRLLNYCKPKKTITLYSPIAKSREGYIYLYGKYGDKKSLFNEGNDQIIGWHELKVTLDEE